MPMNESDILRLLHFRILSFEVVAKRPVDRCAIKVLTTSLDKPRPRDADDTAM
jgi:hypothetical protein